MVLLEGLGRAPHQKGGSKKAGIAVARKIAVILHSI